MDEGYGVGTTKLAVYLDFKDAIIRYGKIEAGKQALDDVNDETITKLEEEALIKLGKVIKEKYGNLFEMYEK
jgi:succinate dehydrogenase / fumarate reductase flavoprotein subunit